MALAPIFIYNTSSHGSFQKVCVSIKNKSPTRKSKARIVLSGQHHVFCRQATL